MQMQTVRNHFPLAALYVRVDSANLCIEKRGPVHFLVRMPGGGKMQKGKLE